MKKEWKTIKYQQDLSQVDGMLISCETHLTTAMCDLTPFPSNVYLALSKCCQYDVNDDENDSNDHCGDINFLGHSGMLTCFCSITNSVSRVGL